jgi:hypothetical protein
MANKSITIKELIEKEEVLRVYNGLDVMWPMQNQVECMSFVQELCSKFDGCYSVNNSTVALVSDKMMYVAPYTRTLIEALAGFEQKSFYVPFSNGDYPLKYQYQWNCLRNAAHESYKADFVADCEEYCNKHHIGAISEETIENCFEMPEMGVQVKHIYYEDVYYPIMNQTCLDCRCEKLGTFCYNNGRVVFVYRNGKTYVAKGYKIIAELEAAGFSKAGLFVPFSNGEEIKDPALRQRWDSKEKCKC